MWLLSSDSSDNKIIGFAWEDGVRRGKPTFHPGSGGFGNYISLYDFERLGLFEFFMTFLR
jgi:hypothetical protein